METNKKSHHLSAFFSLKSLCKNFACASSETDSETEKSECVREVNATAARREKIINKIIIESARNGLSS